MAVYQINISSIKITPMADNHSKMNYETVLRTLFFLSLAFMLGGYGVGLYFLFSGRMGVALAFFLLGVFSYLVYLCGLLYYSADSRCDNLISLEWDHFDDLRPKLWMIWAVVSFVGIVVLIVFLRKYPPEYSLIACAFVLVAYLLSFFCEKRISDVIGRRLKPHLYPPKKEDRRSFKKERKEWKSWMMNLEIMYDSHRGGRTFFDMEKPIALILGNGFDIDYGYATGYNDFVSSGFWPFRDRDDSSSLGGYLNNRVKDHWHDLEEGLYEFAQANPFMESAEKDFDELVYHLRLFIDVEQKHLKIQQGLAMELLQALIYSGKECKVFSFNYTDFQYALAYARGLYRDNVDLSKTPIAVPENFSVSYVHGQAAHNNLILGTRDLPDDLREWSFLCKSSSPDYYSSGITRQIGDYETVIIFGHSLSVDDYPYFRTFFKGIMDGTVKCEQLIVYTQDEQSLRQFEANLWAMGIDLKMMEFKNKCDYTVVFTSSPILENPNHQRVLLSLYGAKEQTDSSWVTGDQSEN